MLTTTKLINSEEYHSFRSSVPLRKIAVDLDPTKVRIICYGASCHMCTKNTLHGISMANIA